MPSDTHPDAARVQAELIRKMTVAQRIARTRSLTATAIELSRRALAEANPHFSPQEVKVAWVELHYGRELADGYRRRLNEGGHEQS